MKTGRHLLLSLGSVALLGLTIYVALSNEPQVNADWRTTADMDENRGFFVAVGRLWGKQNIPLRSGSTEWVPLFLVVSDFEVERENQLEGGFGGGAKVGFNFSGGRIDVPVSPDVPAFTQPREPEEPNVFILNADNSLELTNLTVRTQKQIDEIPYKLRGKGDFAEIRRFLETQLGE